MLSKKKAMDKRKKNIHKTLFCSMDRRSIGQRAICNCGAMSITTKRILESP